MMRTAHLQLIGGVRLDTPARTIGLSDTATRLLAYAALHEHAVTRPVVAAVLWPESPEERAGANLRAALWRLGPEIHEFLDVGSETIGLAPHLGVDVRELRSRCLRMVRRGHVDDAVGSDPRLLQGLLPGHAEPWMESHRERWRQLRLHTIAAYAEQLCDAGRDEAALALLDEARAREPRHEALRRNAARARSARSRLRVVVA